MSCLRWWRQLATATLLLPAFHAIPPHLSSNLFRIVRRRTFRLTALDLTALHVFPDFFLCRLMLGHCSLARLECSHKAASLAQYGQRRLVLVCFPSTSPGSTANRICSRCNVHD